MNPEIKQAWVAALRSGEYKQGVGQLNENGDMCCLGVLCDLHSKATGNQWEGDYGVKLYGQHDCLPPSCVVQWAGLKEESPYVKIQVSENPEDTMTQPLSELNDNGSTFEEIADLIEEQL